MLAIQREFVADLLEVVHESQTAQTPPPVEPTPTKRTDAKGSAAA
jgi:hypothetical protein